LDRWPGEPTRHRFRSAVSRHWGRVVKLVDRMPGSRRDSQIQPMTRSEYAGAVPPEVPIPAGKVSARRLFKERYWPRAGWGPRIYDGPITLFRTEKLEFWRVHSRDFCWEIRTSVGVQVI